MVGQVASTQVTTVPVATVKNVPVVTVEQVPVVTTKQTLAPIVERQYA